MPIGPPHLPSESIVNISAGSHGLEYFSEASRKHCMAFFERCYVGYEFMNITTTNTSVGGLRGCTWLIFRRCIGIGYGVWRINETFSNVQTWPALLVIVMRCAVVLFISIASFEVAGMKTSGSCGPITGGCALAEMTLEMPSC